jgi:hypothetical protein
MGFRLRSAASGLGRTDLRAISKLDHWGKGR